MATVYFAILFIAILFGTNSQKKGPPQDAENVDWTKIFHCTDTPNSDVEFYALDLEDIQSLIVESNSQKILISGNFGKQRISIQSKQTITSILSETLLVGRAISTFAFSTNDWIYSGCTGNLCRECLESTQECSYDSYVPNIWYEACGNDDGLHIIRNGSDSLCTFQKSAANVINSDITISIDSNPGLPAITNAAEPSVFDTLDSRQEYARDQFPDITFIATDEYVDIVENIAEINLCLIDARETYEWDIGRIENAIPISYLQVATGNITDKQVIQTIEEKCDILNGDDYLIAVYCLTSIRGSNMATYLINDLGYDASNVVVIEGAIARWANERKTMINDDGITTLVHTFSTDAGNAYVLPEYRYCC